MEFQTQAFWLKSVTFKADISDAKYFTLFPIKEGVDKLLAKALELNTEKHVIGEWRQLAVLVNNLIEGLQNKSHTEAIKNLKNSLGGACELNEENSRLARIILRDSQRGQRYQSCNSGDNRICHLLSWLLLFLQTKVFPNQLLMLLLMLEAALIVTGMPTWRETVLSHIEIMALKGGRRGGGRRMSLFSSRGRN